MASRRPPSKPSMPSRPSAHEAIGTVLSTVSGPSTLGLDDAAAAAMPTTPIISAWGVASWSAPHPAANKT